MSDELSLIRYILLRSVWLGWVVLRSINLRPSGLDCLSRVPSDKLHSIKLDSVGFGLVKSDVISYDGFYCVQFRSSLVLLGPLR